MIHNSFIFIGSAFAVVGFSLFCLKWGRSMLIAWVSLLGILANLFVLKQISLFGFNATASDVFAVGSLYGLNLLREHFGLEACKEAILVSFLCMLFFTLMGQVHLLYTPSGFDETHMAYSAILSPTPRIMIASIIVFFTVQVVDVALYHAFRFIIPSVMLRNTLTLTLSQGIDTICFSVLGLSGLVDNMIEIIVISYLIKLVAIACMVPFTSASKHWNPLV